MPELAKRRIMNDKGNYCVKQVPRLSEVAKMRLDDILKILVRCPFSQYFCEETHVLKLKYKKVEDGRQVLSKMIIEWTAFSQLGMI